MATRIHPSALVEEGVSLGDGSDVWDNAHLRAGAVVGRDCIVGEKTYLAPDVRIGDRVKLNAMVYVCTGVHLADGVMVGASTTFTNDRFPRATTPDLSELRPSEADEHTLETYVHEGATIGAGCTIGPGIEIGRFAMVGMGSVVTRSVPAFALVYGNPARQQAWVCRCGEPLDGSGVCQACGRRYTVGDDAVEEPA